MVKEWPLERDLQGLSRTCIPSSLYLTLDLCKGLEKSASSLVCVEPPLSLFTHVGHKTVEDPAFESYLIPFCLWGKLSSINPLDFILCCNWAFKCFISHAKAETHSTSYSFLFIICT